ncbi:dipeptidase [Elongatibacter sediminis]|uniref:Dipeptidase n=1 Tax=Elongatibacter sediminis TaxID=3119006 RepID=A0AAW9RHJ8_9GAMM
MNLFTKFILLAFLVPVPAAAQETQHDLAASASQITQQSYLVDTHIDVPYRLKEQWSDVSHRTDGGDFDYERARQGGLDLPFMSIYTPAESEDDGTAWQLANELIDSVEALAARAPKRFALARNTQEAENARQRGLIGLAMGMENGAPIDGELENLAYFKQRGISYITLAHSKSNHISDSSYDPEKKWNGLSPFGREVVAEMNRLGIMIDISHVSDEAFYDVLELSRAPVIASHSSARHFTPGFERNMSDDMIRALAANGGVIQINFGSSFLTSEARAWYERLSELREAWAESTGLPMEGDHASEWVATYREQNPMPYATLSDVVDHFDHVIGLVGVEHVGIGSDFDGVGDSLPEGIKDVSQYPALVEEFLRRGYETEDIEAILGGNLMRVWADVERASAANRD